VTEKVISTVRLFLPSSRRVGSLALVPLLVAALLLSVIIPALEMQRVTRLLKEITASIVPTLAVSAKLEQVARHERQSLFVNAVLVMIALGATGVVISVSRRERRLTAVLQRRIREESAISQMSRALSETGTLEDAIQRILEGTTATMHSVGAYIEIVSYDTGGFVSSALMDSGSVVRLDAHDGLANSVTETTRAQSESGVLHELRGMERWLRREVTPACVHCKGLVVPLLSSGELFGVLVLVRDARGQSFGENDWCLMRLIGDLATSVIRRVEVERRAFAEMQQRATSETALREAAEALAAAFTMDDVAQQIARSALDATQADGAFVETIDSAPDGSFALMVRGVAGTSMPALGTSRPYAGSFIEHAVDQEAASIVVDYRIAYPSGATREPADESRPAIVLPIRHPRGPIGALLIVGASKTPFSAGDTGWAQTITHLAALAYEKVRLLDEARGGRQELERVMKSRQRLLRGFSHDVKNPLGAADGYADLLGGGVYGELPEKQKESVNRIRRSIRRALDLIDDLHELARTETGHIVLHREVVDLGELVRTSADEYRGAAYAAGLSLSIDVAEDLPLVETDSVRVNQIVGNLVSNAIKYTKTGAVTLRVRRYPAAAIRNVPSWVDIEVVDTGRGIPSDKKEQIFEEFSRLDTSDRPGAGLGLAISQRLAEALQGEITVQSELGRGSTFTLRIPVSIPDESNKTPRLHLMDEFHPDRKIASAGI
jgi:signal transduction histidine kinase